MEKYIGIDIGSTAAKYAVCDDNKLLILDVFPTGWSSVDTSNLIKQALEKKGVDVEHSFCVSTGYGRVSVPFADKNITEITCHAKGASYLYKENSFVVIDIGGQDTKIIKIKDNAVVDFLMNEKCAAGTGRFLEVMANTMGVKLGELEDLAKEGRGVKISSMCTVFAESEVISLIGRGEKRENIANAVFSSIVEKVAVQAAKLCDNEIICITGGLCNSEYIVDKLGSRLKSKIKTNEKARFAGAIGAALFARENAKKRD